MRRMCWGSIASIVGLIASSYIDARVRCLFDSFFVMPLVSTTVIRFFSLFVRFSTGETSIPTGSKPERIGAWLLSQFGSAGGTELPRRSKSAQGFCSARLFPSFSRGSIWNRTAVGKWGIIFFSGVHSAQFCEAFFNGTSTNPFCDPTPQSEATLKQGSLRSVRRNLECFKGNY